LGGGGGSRGTSPTAVFKRDEKEDGPEGEKRRGKVGVYRHQNGEIYNAVGTSGKPLRRLIRRETKPSLGGLS